MTFVCRSLKLPAAADCSEQQPAHSYHSDISAESQPAEDVLGRMPATILIADDHETSLAGLEALLHLEGYHVVCAHEGRNSARRIRQGKA